MSAPQPNPPAGGQPPGRTIDWSFIFLAAFAGVGLVLSVVTAWKAWSEPMLFLPDSYVISALALACSIGAAIGLTYTTQPQHKVFIGAAILMGIFLQLQTLGLTEQGHHLPPRAIPAAENAPKPAAPAPQMAPASPETKK